MTVETLLTETVGWLTDVNVKEVHLEYINGRGYRSLLTCSMEDRLEDGANLAHFYALNDDGFYFGHLGSGSCSYFEYMDTLLEIMDDQELTMEFLIENPKEIGSMITDIIIDDKDIFVGPVVLMSYQQIYWMYPVIDHLRDHLIEYYEHFVQFHQEIAGEMREVAETFYR